MARFRLVFPYFHRFFSVAWSVIDQASLDLMLIVALSVASANFTVFGVA